MKRTIFGLFAAAAMVSSQAVAADSDTSRSAGAHPVVQDDYPESDVVIDVGKDIVLTITGEARTRFEWVENTTDFSSDGFDGTGDDTFFDDSLSYAPARFNLGFRVDLPRDVAAVIELQGNFELGGSPAGLGTELRAQTTQHQRPGVINPSPTGLGLGHVGHANDSLGDPADPKHLEIVRALNSSLNDGVFVYQGYIEAAHIGDSIFSVRFGRQEMAYGTEWLMGNQDWYDGQTFDGIKGIFEFTDKHRLDLFWAKLAERDTTLDGGLTPLLNQGGDDSDLYGAYFTAQSLGGSSIGMDAYLIGLSDDANIQWDLEAQDDGIAGYNADDNGFNVSENLSYLDSWWAGVRFFREREHGFTFSAEVTYQWGDVEASLDNDGDGIEDDDNLSIGAWGLETFFAYTWDTPTNPSLKGGLTFATGSDVNDYEDGDSATFFTPAGEVHPRLGMMDLVDASNVMALNIGYAGSSNRHSWGVDLWHFEYDEVDPFIEDATISDAAIDAGDDLSNELGQELDLWYNYQYSEHMVAQFAISYFNAGGYFEDLGDCADEGGVCDPSTDGGDPTDLQVDDAWRVYANLLVRF
jgi:hypothetical protein